MNRSFFLIFFVCVLFRAVPLFGQLEHGSEIISFDGKYYQYHTVEKGETFFSVMKKYSWDKSELIRLNPIAADGLKTGSKLLVPAEIKKDKNHESFKIPEKEKIVFLVHVVGKKETVFSITKQYNIDSEELIRYNPQAGKGIRTNERLKIPKSLSPSTVVTKIDTGETSFTDYKVKPGETIYSLAKLHGLTIDELRDLNPDAPDPLPVGWVLKVKSNLADNKEKGTQSKDKQGLETQGMPFGNEDKGHTKIKKSDTLAIALMMPFYFEKNSVLNTVNSSDTSTVVSSGLEETIGIDSVQVHSALALEVYDQSKPALNFYEGFLLALDTLQKEGVNVKVKIYDTEQKVSKIISDPWLLEAGLIIGPRDVKQQPPVSAFSAKNRIPMVAPFLADDTLVHQSPYFFQLTPSKKSVLEQTADFVAERYVGQNIIVLTTGDFRKTNEWKMIERLKDQLSSHSHLKKGGHIAEVPFTGGGDQGHIQTRGSMKKELENVVLVPLTDNRRAREAMLARVVNALQVLSKNFSITLVGLSDYPKFESINTEYYHQLNLHYLTPSFIDYEDPAVQGFIKKYRDNYKGEPDPYSFRGYDIGLFFGEAYRNYGNGFVKQITSVKAKSLQDHFYFKRNGQLEGFVSQSLFVVNYNTNWEIRKAGLLIGDKITLFRPDPEVEKPIEP